MDSQKYTWQKYSKLEINMENTQGQHEEKNWFYYHLRETYGKGVAERYWDVKIGAWAKRQRSQIKKVSAGLFTWKGETGTAQYWADRLGISKVSFYERIRRLGLTESSFLPNRRKHQTSDTAKN